MDVAGLIQAVFWCYCHRNLNKKKASVNLMTSEKGPPVSDSSTEGTLEKKRTKGQKCEGKSEKIN